MDTTIFGLLYRRFGGRAATIQEARVILGRERVHRMKRVRRCWNAKTKRPRDPMLGYTKADFRWCAKQNKKGLADWSLAYVIGFSARHMYRLKGTGPQLPCFFAGNTLWLRPNEDSWATRAAPSGYYLIDFKLRYKNMAWEDQEARIRKERKGCARLPENVTIESIFSIQMLTGRRFLERELHSGCSVDSFGYRVRVGYNDTDGIVINSVDMVRKDSGVLRYLKPRIPAKRM